MTEDKEKVWDRLSTPYNPWPDDAIVVYKLIRLPEREIWHIQPDDKDGN